jgi:hypothetical protein
VKDPKRARQLLIDLVKVEIGPDCNIKHFAPDDWPGAAADLPRA